MSRPGPDLRAQRARGVREQDELGAQRADGAHRYRDRGRVDALVEVRAALEHRDRDARERADDEAPGVPGDAADGEARAARRTGSRRRPAPRRRRRRGRSPGRGAARGRAAPAGRRPRTRSAASVTGRSFVKECGSRSASVSVLADPLRAGEVDRRVGLAELAQALAAAAAGRDELGVGHDDDLRDPAAAARDERADRRRLGALALGVGGVLDVRAGVQAAGLVAQGDADARSPSTARRHGPSRRARGRRAGRSRRPARGASRRSPRPRSGRR